jgi:hypothetical protein
MSKPAVVPDRITTSAARPGLTALLALLRPARS